MNKLATRKDITGPHGKLARRETFTGNSLSATWGGPADPGQLPEPWRHQYAACHSAGTLGYVVVSYRTPIAWVRLDTGEIVIPDARYSATTSKHQSDVRAWLR